jgi:glutathione peroxidase-family protein
MTRNPWLFRSIWLIALLPMLIAWSLALFGQADSFAGKNHGQLLPAGIQAPDSLKSELNGKWGLLLLSQDCRQACQQQLYQMQQLHTAMGRDLERVQPLWLSTAGISQRPADINFQQIKSLSRPQLLDWFNQQQLDWQDQSLWLVDPKGMLVMRFAPELKGKHILADIDWLLKASHIG